MFRSITVLIYVSICLIYSRFVQAGTDICVTNFALRGKRAAPQVACYERGGMRTTVLLIRHAAHAFLGRVLVGRTAGVNLSREGSAQAEHLAERLASARIAAIYVSPRERATETAAPLAQRLGLAPRIETALDEFDFGEWAGRSFEALEAEPLWPPFNRLRSVTRPPGGETMLEVQARVVAFLDGCRGKHPGETVAVISHGDVLKAALLHYLGAPIDHFLRFEIEPAAISVLELADWGPRLLRLNETSGAMDRPPEAMDR
jgi:probable phosphomutase (TIGR03848 family)